MQGKCKRQAIGIAKSKRRCWDGHVATLHHMSASRILPHPALKQADQAVWNALREPAGAALIFVVGPTGVGKTTLLTQIEKRLLDLALSQGEHCRTSLPTLKLDAVSPALTQFKWGDYYQRALLLLQEPRVEYTVDYRRPIP